MARVVISGTGTEVGKTHVVSCLLRAARAAGRTVAAYKPIATGVAERCADAERHAAAAGRDYVAPTFAFEAPVSPHLAARQSGRSIDLIAVRDRATELGRGVDLLVIEAAGGLFTPLARAVTNVDLVATLAPDVLVVVAPDRLGALHDVGATLGAARAHKVTAPLVVLSTPSVGDASTGTNAEELRALRIAEISAVFPHAAPDAPESLAAGDTLLDAIDACMSLTRR